MIYFFYFINPRHPFYILVPGERLLFWGFFDGVISTYTYKKNARREDVLRKRSCRIIRTSDENSWKGS